MIRPRFKLIKYLLISTSGLFFAVFLILAAVRIRESVEVLGQVSLRTPNHIFSPASGFIHSIFVEEGQLVKKGQVLAYLRSNQEPEKIEVLSPADGLIYSINLDNLSQGYVRKGEVLMVLFDPYQMRFRALIPENSIPLIEKGLEATLFIDAFPYQRFGTFTGVVTSVSPMPETQQQSIFYPATLLIEKPYVESGTVDKDHRLFLKPGMSGKARIITRSNVSILQRLLKGFLR